MNYKTTKQWFCLFALLLLGSVNTFAQKLTISDATIKAGETAELTISLMSGEVTVYGIQTDIVLPEGLTMAKPKNVETSLVDEDYEATVSFNKNNNRLILTSMDGIAFKTETAVATFKVTAAENFVNQDGAIVSINTKNTKFTTSTTGTEVNATEEAAAKVEAEYYAYTIPATISFEGASVGTGICTYAKDVKEGQVSQMQAVNNWTIVSNGDARAAGVFALGSDAFLGGEGILPPAADINGVTTGNVLGLCGVWTGAAQYTQNLKLAAGQYYIIVPVYNAAGAEALSQNNIGFFADNGNKYVAETTQYAVGEWTKEVIKVNIAEETSGKLSLGIVAVNEGSSKMPHLFIGAITITTKAPEDLIQYEYSAMTGEYTEKNQNGNYAKTWISTQEPGLSLSTAANNMVVADGGLHTSVYTITAPAGYLIASYSFNGVRSDAADITVTAGEQTVTFGAESNRIEVEDINAASTTFTVSGAYLKVSNFYIYVKIDPDYVAPLPTLAAGTYYMYNVGAAGYLIGGNNWGTRATISKNAAIPVTATLTNGKYVLCTSPIYHRWANDAITALAYLPSAGDQKGFVDGASNAAWTISSQEDGTYKLQASDGTYFFADTEATTTSFGVDPNTDYSKWKFITEAEYIEALAAATKDAPLNASALIKNSYFGRASTISGSFNGEIKNWEGAPALGGEGNDGDYNGEKFNTTYDVYQKLTGIPAGVYRVDVQGYYRNGLPADLVADPTAEQLLATFYAKATDENIAEAPLMSILAEVGKDGMVGNTYAETVLPNSQGQAAQCFAAGLYKQSLYIQVGNEGTLQIGIKKSEAKANDWTCFDNFQLTYFGSETTVIEVALGDLYDQVQALRTEAQTKAADTENTPDEAIAILGQAIDATATLAMSREAYEAAIETLTKALDEAKPIIQALADYKAAVAALNALADKLQAQVDATDTYTGDEAATAAAAAIKAIKEAEYADAAAAKAAEAQVVAAAKAFFAGIEAKAAIDITDWYIVNPTPVAHKAMAEGWEGDNFGDSSDSVSEYWNRSAVSFRQTIALPAGFYNLTAIALTRTDMVATLAAGNADMAIATVANTVVNSRAQAAAWFNEGNGVNVLPFDVEEAGDVTISLTADATTGDHWMVWRNFKLEMVAAPTTVDVAVSAAGFATFSSKYALDFSAAKDIAAYTAKLEGDVVTFQKATAVPANTGLLIRSLSGEAVTEAVAIVKEATAVENALVATTEALSGAALAGKYILLEGANGVGFYKAGDASELAAGKAYIESNGAEIKAFVFEDLTTGLVEVKNEGVKSEGSIFNLAGQRVNKAQKGVFIVNGKKVVVK